MAVYGRRNPARGATKTWRPDDKICGRGIEKRRAQWDINQWLG